MSRLFPRSATLRVPSRRTRRRDPGRLALGLQVSLELGEGLARAPEIRRQRLARHVNHDFTLLKIGDDVGEVAGRTRKTVQAGHDELVARPKGVKKSVKFWALVVGRACRHLKPNVVAAGGGKFVDLRGQAVIVASCISVTQNDLSVLGGKV